MNTTGIIPTKKSGVTIDIKRMVASAVAAVRRYILSAYLGVFECVCQREKRERGKERTYANASSTAYISLLKRF